MDNTGLFYDVPYEDDNEARIETELQELLRTHGNPNSRGPERIFPYVNRVDPEVVGALSAAATELGITTRLGATVTNSGFFASQGRDIARVTPTFPEFDRILAAYDPQLPDQRIENLEMEVSFLIHFFSRPRPCRWRHLCCSCQSL